MTAGNENALISNREQKNSVLLLAVNSFLTSEDSFS